MLAFPEAWKHHTLEMCCRVNFQFMFEECMDDLELALNLCPGAIVETPGHTMKWYVVYHPNRDPECVQDCGTGPDCNSWTEYHEELYESYGECCVNHLWWVKNIQCSEQTSAEYEDAGETKIEHALEWYVVYHPNQDPECVQDCVSGPYCHRIANFNDEGYTSFDECCSYHLWWLTNSPCPSAW